MRDTQANKNGTGIWIRGNGTGNTGVGKAREVERTKSREHSIRGQEASHKALIRRANSHIHGLYHLT